jgi:hypothetical protein
VKRVSIFFLLIFSCACSSVRQTTPSAIGFITLNNYVLHPDFLVKDDFQYIFMGNAEEFHKRFSMTKSSPVSIIVPDFSSQSVVAILLKPTEKVVTVHISKAEIEGNELKIFYNLSDTTSRKTYAQTPMVVATVPKSASVKQVSFFRGSSKEKTIAATY